MIIQGHSTIQSTALPSRKSVLSKEGARQSARKRGDTDFSPRLLRACPGEVTDCSCPCVLQSYRSQCLAMLKTRLPDAELAPNRCFISTNARWKPAQPLLVLLHQHFVVCEPRSEGQVQLVLLPTGLAEEVRAVPGGCCGAGGAASPPCAARLPPQGLLPRCTTPLCECDEPSRPATDRSARHCAGVTARSGGPTGQLQNHRVNH